MKTGTIGSGSATRTMSPEISTRTIPVKGTFVVDVLVPVSYFFVLELYVLVVPLCDACTVPPP